MTLKYTGLKLLYKFRAIFVDTPPGDVHLLYQENRRLHFLPRPFSTESNSTSAVYNVL
jgi:hypothetical protein